MKLGKYVIHRASTIKRLLGTSNLDIKSDWMIRLIQIYECRILGLCFYRNELSYYGLKDQISKMIDDRGWE